MQVEKGMFLPDDTTALLAPADAALPAKTAHDIISDRPFSEFVVGYIGDKLRTAFKYEDAGPKPLVGLRGFEDASTVAQGLVEAFASLPWRYTFIYPLPLKATYLAGAAEEDREYSLGDDLRLVRPGPSFTKTYGAQSSGGTLADLLTAHLVADKPTSWPADTLYLVHTAKGFLTDSFATQLAKDVRLLARTLGGLLEASGVAKYHYTSPSAWLTYSSRDRWIYAYEERDGAWHPASSVIVEGDYAERLDSLQWLEIPEVQERQWDLWMNTVATRMRPAFVKSDDAARLRRCSQWHFDSQCGSNRLLQFVQATVAIEILLGDKATSDKMGLGELLANRCAYSLATDPHERETLLAQFKKSYDTRSMIVHRGKADLSVSELDQLWELMWIGRRLIRHELDLMDGSKKASR
jgi:hypothetical protein